MFQQYFGRSFETQSNEQIESLQKWASDCDQYFRNITNTGVNGFDPHLERLKVGMQAGIQMLQQLVEVRRSAAEIAGIPACEDKSTVSALKAALKTQAYKILGLKDFSDVSSQVLRGSRLCQVDALFNVGEAQIVYSVKWFDKSSGQISIMLLGLF